MGWLSQSVAAEDDERPVPAETADWALEYGRQATYRRRHQVHIVMAAA
ncbi:hypothetical protein [uncultured Aeromicrobium sp.]|nr:hypothetical protein [uncultured Aeromicrobium sp.]